MPMRRPTPISQYWLMLSVFFLAGVAWSELAAVALGVGPSAVSLPVSSAVSRWAAWETSRRVAVAPASLPSLVQVASCWSSQSTAPAAWSGWPLWVRARAAQAVAV